MTIWAWGERKPTLYTIPFSHYCEVARWSLEAAGEPFEEAPFLPGTHLFAPVERLRTDAKDDSSTGRGTTMPMLVESSGKVLAGGLVAVRGATRRRAAVGGAAGDA
jgi:glutathione S-transferase